MPNSNSKLILSIWERLEKLKKTVYIVESWGITPKSLRATPKEVIEWEDLEEILDSVEDENKTIKENSSDRASEA